MDIIIAYMGLWCRPARQDRPMTMFKRLQPTSISQKFNLGLMMIVVIVMLIFSSLMFVINFRSGEKELSEKLSSIMEKTRVSLPTALWTFNHDYVGDYIDSLFLNEDLVFVRVTGSGHTIKEKFRSGFRNPDLESFRQENRFVVMEHPIKYKTYQVGGVILVASRDRIKKRAVDNSLAVILVAFINIVAIFLTTYVLSRKNIFKPLTSLEKSVREVGQGNLDTPIDTGCEDEIGTLAKAFEGMMTNLKETMASKEELEREIRDRRLAEDQSIMMGEILEQSFNEIYIFNAESLKFIMVNQGARGNIGYSMAELRYMTPLDITPEFDPESFQSLIRPLLEDSREAIRFNTIHRRKDGSEYNVEVLLQLMWFRTISVFVAIILDITDRLAWEHHMLASVRVKEVLLREIHHRVKNNMQIIQSLLSLQIGKTDSPVLKLALQDSNNRIKSMALVHETLYQSENLANLDIRKYIEQIIRYLSKIYRDADTVISISLEMDEIIFDLDKSIACGLIINELVTNSLKYAFAGRAEGHIRVTFRLDGQDTVLIVSDNGRGLPPDTDIESTGSLGLKIVRMLVADQLDGELEIRQDAELAFHMRLPSGNREEGNG